MYLAQQKDTYPVSELHRPPWPVVKLKSQIGSKKMITVTGKRRTANPVRSELSDGAISQRGFCQPGSQHLTAYGLGGDSHHGSSHGKICRRAAAILETKSVFHERHRGGLRKCICRLTYILHAYTSTIPCAPGQQYKKQSMEARP